MQYPFLFALIGFKGQGYEVPWLFFSFTSLLAGRKEIRMKNLVAKNKFGMYADNNGVARVDSLAVADAFNKDHRNVIRDIRNLDCSEEF